MNIKLSGLKTGFFRDQRDGKLYKTVRIGKQEWFAENLAYLPSVVGPATGSTTVSHYYVYGYNGTDVNAAKATGNYSTYGVLYNWPAAMGGSTTEGVQGVCPDGWYLPTDADYKELEMYLGMTQEDADTLNAWRNSGSVGSKLGTFTSGGNNSSGFTALAGGRRITEGSFSSELTSAFFWSSSPSTGNTVSRNLSSSNVGVGRNALNRANGFSVRCMRDFDFEDEEGLYQTTEYVDGITFMVKKTLPNIDDYKTKEDWENWEENGVFNIKGLRSNTEYSLKISALYGDLTESVPSEPVSATTSLGSLHFRIGLGKEDGEDTNFNPPYEIFFDGGFRLVRGAGVKKSDKLIWSLINTNSNRGVTMVKKGEYGGLYNEDLEYTISSVSGDINSETEGIGLKNFSKSQLFSDDDGLLSKIEVEEEYNSEEENMVGNIEDVFKRIYFSSGPIHTGKTSIRIFAKAALDTPEVNYDEDITFVLVPKY